MSTSTTVSQDETLYTNSLKLLNNRPSILVGVLWVLPLLWFNRFIEFEGERLFFYGILLAPLALAGIIEHIWINWGKSNTFESRRQFAKIKGFRMIFFAAGGLSAILMMLLILVLIPTMVSFEENYARAPNLPVLLFRSLSVAYLFLLILIVYVLGSIYGSILYQLKSRQLEERRLKFYFQSPVHLLTLITYYYLGWMILSSWSWLGAASQQSSTIFRSNLSLDNAVLFDVFLYGGGGLYIILTTTSFLGFIQGSIHFPNFFQADRVSFEKIYDNRRTVYKNAILIFLLVILGIIAIHYPTRRVAPELASSVHLVIILIPAGYILYLFRKSELPISFCRTCGFERNTNQCQICTEPQSDFDLSELPLSNIPQLGMVEHPTCPNCKNQWDNLSRQCSTCGYTIILTCEKCTQTLNPLWKECNRCGTKRKPIPNIAMSISRNKKMGVNQGKMMYLLIFLIFLELSIYKQFSDKIEIQNLGIFELNRFEYPLDELIFFLIIFTIIICLSYLMYNTLNSHSQPLTYILSFWIFYPVTMTFLYLSTWFVIYLLGYDGTLEISPLVKFLIISISAGVIAIQVRNVYRNIISAKANISDEENYPEVIV